MSDNTITITNRTFQAVPCSCRCGGSWAWVEVEDGKHTMIGCVCHNTLPVGTADPRLGESSILSLWGTVVQLKSKECTCHDVVGDDLLCTEHGI